jgi:short-subunit dehydrogenase
MELNGGTTVLVTGASGGIGRAIARAVHEEGAKLILTGRRVDAMREIAGQTGARVIACDLADRAQAAKLLDDAGPIDVLVANAGLPASGSVLQFTPEEIDRALDVNLRAPMQLARALAPSMIERKRGSLVFISSVAGMLASAATTVYSATKFGLRGFALGLHSDLLRHGVGCSVIFPGFIRDAGMFAETETKLPFGVGTRSPDDVADAVLDAVRRNPPEIVVASAEQRLSARVAGLAPGLVFALEKLLIKPAVLDNVVERQKVKR